MPTEINNFRKMIREQIIVKAIELNDRQKQHHHEIINLILNFNADDNLNDYRVALKLAYKDLFEKYPYCVTGIIYKQLELTATDLRKGEGIFYKNIQKLKESSDTAQGIWELT